MRHWEQPIALTAVNVPDNQVPQANLAPELRRAEPVAAGNAAGDAEGARAALSRYQASRLAALHAQADARSRS